MSNDKGAIEAPDFAKMPGSVVGTGDGVSLKGGTSQQHPAACTFWEGKWVQLSDPSPCHGPSCSCVSLYPSNVVQLSPMLDSAARDKRSAPANTTKAIKKKKPKKSRLQGIASLKSDGGGYCAGVGDRLSLLCESPPMDCQLTAISGATSITQNSCTISLKSDGKERGGKGDRLSTKCESPLKEDCQLSALSEATLSSRSGGGGTAGVGRVFCAGGSTKEMLEGVDVGAQAVSVEDKALGGDGAGDGQPSVVSELACRSKAVGDSLFVEAGGRLSSQCEGQQMDCQLSAISGATLLSDTIESSGNHSSAVATAFYPSLAPYKVGADSTGGGDRTIASRTRSRSRCLSTAGTFVPVSRNALVASAVPLSDRNGNVFFGRILQSLFQVGHVLSKAFHLRSSQGQPDLPHPPQSQGKSQFVGKHNADYMHAFKDRKTNCSIRTKVYKVVAETACANLSYTQSRKHLAKKTLQDELLTAVEPGELVMLEPFLKDNVVCFDGRAKVDKLVDFHSPDDACTKMVSCYSFSVVDGPSSLKPSRNIQTLKSSSHKGFVFRPIPGKPPVFLKVLGESNPYLKSKATKNFINTEVIGALQSLSNINATSDSRSTRIMKHQEGTKYNLGGMRAKQGNGGELSISLLHKLKRKEWIALVKFIVLLEDVVVHYMDKNVVDGFKKAKNVGDFSCFPVPEGYKGRRPQFFCAVASGPNLFLECHMDIDFFFSVVISLSPGVQSGNFPILNHFVFPTYGLSVALRHMDILIFNPLKYHCASSKSTDRDVICTSAYMKTAVVGKNLNKIPLTEVEHEVWRMMQK